MIIVDLFNLLDKNSSGISAAALIIGGIWAFLKFREYLKDKRFNAYHTLIKELVDETQTQGGLLKTDRQIAIIFELKSFPNYFPVSIRILKGLKEDWANGSKRVIKEIEISLEYMSTNRFKRIFRKKN